MHNSTLWPKPQPFTHCPCLTSSSTTSRYHSDFYFQTYQPLRPDRIPAVIEAQLFFRHSPCAVKLQPTRTPYLHPSPDWCICSLPLVAFVLRSPQEKPLNILSQALSPFLLLKKNNNTVNLPFVCTLFVTDYALSVGRERSGEVRRHYLSLEITGCCDLPWSPLLHYWSLGSCLVCPSAH